MASTVISFHSLVTFPGQTYMSFCPQTFSIKPLREHLKIILLNGLGHGLSLEITYEKAEADRRMDEIDRRYLCSPFLVFIFMFVFQACSHL